MKRKNVFLVVPLLLMFSSCSLFCKYNDAFFDVRIKEGRYNCKSSFSYGDIVVDYIEILFDRKISLSYPSIDNELVDYSYAREERFKWNFSICFSIQGEIYHYSVGDVKYSTNQKNIYKLYDVKCASYSSLCFDEIELYLVNKNEDVYAEEMTLRFSGYENCINLINTSIKHKIEFKGMVYLIDYSKSETLTDYYYDFEKVCFFLKSPNSEKIPYIIDQEGNRLDYINRTYDGYFFSYDMIDKDVILEIKLYEK